MYSKGNDITQPLCKPLNRVVNPASRCRPLIITIIILDDILSEMKAKHVKMTSKMEKANAINADGNINGTNGQESTNKSPFPFVAANNEPYNIKECIAPKPIPAAMLEVTSFNGKASADPFDADFINISVFL